VQVSYSTLRRYLQRELGLGGPRVTVRLADTAPGEEAQVDFGHVGWRRSAPRWCAEVAGARIHGTTRAVPRVVFLEEQQAHLAPPP
jgi:hypothetical protein